MPAQRLGLGPVVSGSHRRDAGRGGTGSTLVPCNGQTGQRDQGFSARVTQRWVRSCQRSRVFSGFVRAPRLSVDGSRSCGTVGGGEDSEGRLASRLGCTGFGQQLTVPFL